MARYKVLVDDNFHYMDDSERVELGTFDTLEAAIATCKRRVDDDLAHLPKLGMSADELFTMYRHFGEDPFIVDAEAHLDKPAFNAWDCEKQSGRDSPAKFKNRPLRTRAQRHQASNW